MQRDELTVSECIFCKIIAREEPASIVYEDETVISLLTINPVNPGHLMVIPKKHVVYMSEMDEDTGMHLFKIALRMQQAIRSSGVRCEGINLFLADGKAAFQSVFHLHLHVFPRFKGDLFKINADWSVRPPRDELDDAAGKIRAAYISLWGEK
ncbi:MAG TPA: HIT family protein [Pyrinomonadaceae bacterium]|nr:HIT family protein [Pyrinomonadaceae bacterium]